MSADSLALLFARIAVAAGGPIMAIHRRGFDTAWKADASPVTEADLAAEALILERLREALPDIPVIAEECVAAGRVPEAGDRFILVDPLDGTREFVAGRREFTVNIALVENGRPVAGAIYAPLFEQVWFAGTACHTLPAAPGADLPAAPRARRVAVRPPPAAGLVALVSLSHPNPETDAYLETLPVAERCTLGSSIKFCLIAQGDADVYPRLSRTCEWDSAAGHAILTAAGGAVTTRDGRALHYGNRGDGYWHEGFVACGGFRLAPGGITLP